MLPLEVVGPGGSLSTMLYSDPAISVRCQLGDLAGGNGDGGIQLRPGDGGARLWLGAGGGNSVAARCLNSVGF
jgi:hypothetical protein